MNTVAIPMAAVATQPGPSASVADIHFSSLASTLFPFLEEIRVDRLSVEVVRMLAVRRVRMDACRQDVQCALLASIWSDDECNVIAAAAEARAVSGRELPDDGLAAQVKRELAGLNSIIRVYGLGMPPRNPDLDGPLFRPGNAAFWERVATALTINRTPHQGNHTLDDSIGLAVTLLDVHDRNDAVAFETVDSGENAAAARRIAATDWSRFTFVAILVPGNGPEAVGETLSPRGKLRVQLAAERFADGAAPFIVVSGGAVHPRGTTIYEAVEMRRALIDRYGVPADRIILEPYARTTSTNLRNAVRRISSLGIPLAGQMLIVTDAEHSKFIGSPAMAGRNISELGYRPGAMGRRLSDTALAFTPSKASLRIDPLDPLDP